MENPLKILFTLIASVSPLLLFAQTDAINIKANGNVGIHTTEPTATMQINGGETRNNNPVLLNLYLPQFRFPTADWAGQYESFRFLQTNIGTELNKYGFKQFNVGAGGVSIGYDLTPSAKSADAFFVNGRVGIGTTNPRAILDVGTLLDDPTSLSMGRLGSVLARLKDGNNTGEGTYLGVRGFSAALGARSFSIEHDYAGTTLSSINFNGNTVSNGNITFDVPKNTRVMSVDATGINVAGKIGISSTHDLDKPMLSLDQTTATWGTVTKFNNYRYLQTNFAGAQNDGNFKQFNVGPGGVSIGYAQLPGFHSKNALYVNGNVGIGTNDPQFPLEIKGTRGSGVGYAGKQFTRYGVENIRDNRSFNSCSVFAEGDFVTKNAFIGSSNLEFSDIRLKKNIHQSSSEEDLATLMHVRVSNYKMIDTINNPRAYKKVIAQQVQEVYPIAVGTSFNTLPNVFQTAVSVTHLHDSLYRITIAKPHQLKVRDKIELKLIGAPDLQVPVVGVNSDKSFIVASNTALDHQEKIFVYGTLAADVLTVDYDAIAMLNVSATQQLAKVMDKQAAEIAALKKQNAELIQENQKLQTAQATTKLTLEAILVRLTQLDGDKQKQTAQVAAMVRE